MESFGNLQSLALIAGVFLQVMGLGFVIYQLKRVNTSIRVSAQSALYQQSSGIRSLLVEHPDLRKYIFDGEPIERDSTDFDRVRTIAEMSLNYLEHLVIQQDSLRAHDISAWRKFVLRTISASPIMQKILDEEPECYSSDLVSLYSSSKLATK